MDALLAHSWPETKAGSQAEQPNRAQFKVIAAYRLKENLWHLEAVWPNLNLISVWKLQNMSKTPVVKECSLAWSDKQTHKQEGGRRNGQTDRQAHSQAELGAK